MKYRSRYKKVSELCGGRCSYNSSETAGCNRYVCDTRGIPADGYCVCKDGFTGTCCGKRGELLSYFFLISCYITWSTNSSDDNDDDNDDNDDDDNTGSPL
jgi:hypothetical protein